MKSLINMHLLETSELFIQKVNHHSTEHKAGEYGEKASNACKRVDKDLGYALVRLSSPCVTPTKALSTDLSHVFILTNT